MEKKQVFSLILAITVVVLLILIAGFFWYRYFGYSRKYLIQNDYYGFKLNTQRSWIAEAGPSYSQDNIRQLLGECKNDKTSSISAYKIGAFRFKDQRYPQDFGVAGNFPTGLSSGAILEVTVNCVPDKIKSSMEKYISGNLKVAGERASEAFLDLSGFGRIKYISFFHNNLQYKISEYIYVSPEDKAKNEEQIRKKYAEIFNKIISNFEFVK